MVQNKNRSIHTFYRRITKYHWRENMATLYF